MDFVGKCAFASAARRFLGAETAWASRQRRWWMRSAGGPCAELANRDEKKSPMGA